MPNEAGAASKAIAEQQAKPLVPPQNDAPSPTRVIASR